MGKLASGAYTFLLEGTLKNFHPLDEEFFPFCNIRECFELSFILFHKKQKQNIMFFLSLWEHGDSKCMESAIRKIQNWQAIDEKFK